MNKKTGIWRKERYKKKSKLTSTIVSCSRVDGSSTKNCHSNVVLYSYKSCHTNRFHVNSESVRICRICVGTCRKSGNILSKKIFFIYFVILSLCHEQNSAQMSYIKLMQPCAVTVKEGMWKRNIEKRNVYMGRSLTFICLCFAIHFGYCQIVNFQIEWLKNHLNRKVDTSQTQIAANATTNCAHTTIHSLFLSFFYWKN